MKGKDLRIVFFGTPEFAVNQLDALVSNGYNVVAAVTMPDKQAGRGLKVIYSAVKEYALQHNIPLLQPANLKDETFLTELAAFRADLQVVVAFRMLPKVVYAMPPLGTFNLHASLLPQYRGAAPINWAIINGETQTGLTTFLLNSKMDEGEIILQHTIDICKEDNFGTLHDRMSDEGRLLTTKTADIIADGNYQTLLQDKSNTLPTSAPKIFKETTIINWNQEGEKIVNFIRGLSPYPCAVSSFLDKKEQKEHTLKVFEATFEKKNTKKSAGIFTIEQNAKIKVSCLDGEVQILDLQLSGKKRMKAGDFLRGWKSVENLTAVEK
ncbi:MAG: methionyl-tRNA formyltransferase [Bacteroidales bacterium]|jgi:methionyl-tRNA formyltransferase|nr:methionyl-tRNA formyltransferase [Bacteroidales bacterium]